MLVVASSSVVAIISHFMDAFPVLDERNGPEVRSHPLIRSGTSAGYRPQQYLMAIFMYGLATQNRMQTIAGRPRRPANRSAVRIVSIALKCHPPVGNVVMRSRTGSRSLIATATRKT